MRKELELRIDEARDSVGANAEGRLTFARRQRIWAAMGPRTMDGIMAVPGPGLRRRTCLAILCVELVVDRWSAAAPDEVTPTELTVLARRYVEGQATREEIWEKSHDFWTRLDAGSEELPRAAYFAGAAAAKTAGVALGDEYFEPRQIEDNGEDRLGDMPDEWDPALLACISYCGEGSSSPPDSEVRRRQFWEWYLTMAVPTAYDLFHN